MQERIRERGDFVVDLGLTGDEWSSRGARRVSERQKRRCNWRAHGHRRQHRAGLQERWIGMQLALALVRRALAMAAAGRHGCRRSSGSENRPLWCVWTAGTARQPVAEPAAEANERIAEPRGLDGATSVQMLAAPVLSGR